MESSKEGNKPIHILEMLIQAAKSEDWGIVDEELSEIANLPEAISWVFNDGLRSRDENIRDLAVSILEKSNHTLDDEGRAVLLGMMNSDKGMYVQTRAAFALYVHGDRSPEVVAKIKEALFDPEVSEIAKKYLAQK